MQYAVVPNTVLAITGRWSARGAIALAKAAAAAAIDLTDTTAVSALWTRMQAENAAEQARVRASITKLVAALDNRRRRLAALKAALA
jgi:hypothetical protein